MANDNSVFGKLGKLGKKALDANAKLNQTLTDATLKMKQNTDGHSIYEAFSPSLGLGKKFVITESSLIVGNTEYPYGELTPIVMTTIPTGGAFDGQAKTFHGEKGLLLQFNEGQTERFIGAMNYANEQIDLIRGKEKNYKDFVQCNVETRLELYDDYLMLYQLASGIANAFGNVFAGGAAGNILMFSDIETNLQSNPDGSGILTIRYKGSDIPCQVYPACMEKVEAFVHYISTNKTDTTTNTANSAMDEKWERIKAEPKSFTLDSSVLSIGEDMDRFNSYRKFFKGLATKETEAAKNEYASRVTDLITYLEFFPKIYDQHLQTLISKAMDVFVSEGIWTETKETLQESHSSNYNKAIAYYNNTVDSVEATSQQNAGAVASLTSAVPNLVGGGFGLKGALKGIAKAEIFNATRNAIENSLIDGASKINPQQQKELYGRVNQNELFSLVHDDYWNIFMSILNVLKSNGQDVWMPSESEEKKSRSIFTNMSNPNFPQDQKLGALIGILSTFPYDADYMRYMISSYGDNDQTRQIATYFGY